MTILTLSFVQSSKKKDIPLFPTDTDEDILRRIRCTAEWFPTYLYFPADFQLQEYRRNPHETPLLDLAIIFEKTFQGFETKVPKLFNELCGPYHLDLRDFLEKWIFFVIHKELKNDENVQFHLLLFRQSYLTQDFLKKFVKPLREKNSERLLNRRSFLDSLTTEWYTEFRKDEEQEKEFEEEKNAQAEERGRMFEGLDGIACSDITELGKIILFEIEDPDCSTGVLFDRIRLNETICVAKYKDFFKIYAPQDFNPKDFEKNIPDFYALCIYNQDGNLSIYINNTDKGIKVQAILSNDTRISSIPALLEFLALDPETISVLNETSAGLLAEFTIDNPPPRKDKEFFYQWSAIQAPLFANLCLNDEIFSRFLSVNDTDKISKKNHSLYLYFYSPVEPQKSKHPEILVGGWNRLSSRFGDLTAIVTPVRPFAEEFKIHIKIIRSINTAVVENFQYIFSRLVQLYNQSYFKWLDVFQECADFKPIVIYPSRVTFSSGSLPDIDPRLFPSNAYFRKCQSSKVPKILSQEQADQIEDPALKLKFPSEPMKGVEPRWYVCHDKPAKDGLVYRFPGLAPLKGIDHPFGVVPCCFVEDRSKKNKETMEKLVSNEIKTGPDPILFKTRNPYRLTTDKILDQTGQLGEIPSGLQDLLEKIQPSFQYSRIGMPNRWKQNSLLACCEYHYGVMNKKTFFRSQEVLYRLLLDSDLSVALQSNCDIGTEGLASILKRDEFLEPSRFLPLLEAFYRVKILVISRNRQQKLEVVVPRFVKMFYWSITKGVPLLIIYQHYGGMTNAMYMEDPPRCELIGFLDKEKELQLQFELKAETQLALQLVSGCFRGQIYNLPLVIPDEGIINVLYRQRIDGLGKARILYFTESQYLAVLKQPIAPLSVPTSNSSFIPSVKNVLAFFRLYKIPIRHAQRSSQFLYLHTDVLAPMIFVTRYGNQGDVPLVPGSQIEILEEEPVFMTFLLPERVSIIQEYQWNQRFASILQDYSVILLSQFLEEQKNLLVQKSIPEIIATFLETRVQFVHEYEKPLPYQVSPLVRKNPKLCTEETGLRLPINLREKISYFLQWFYTMKPDELQRLSKSCELPSFYQFVDDFSRQRDHLIQRTLTPVEKRSEYPYLRGPLDGIGLFQGMRYYYDPLETPKPVPYILFTEQTINATLEMASQYLSSEEDLVMVTKYFFREKGQVKWRKVNVQKTARGPVLSIYKIDPDHFIGLLEFSNNV